VESRPGFAAGDRYGEGITLLAIISVGFSVRNLALLLVAVLLDHCFWVCVVARYACWIREQILRANRGCSKAFADDMASGRM